jgi:hypothetical protein
MKHNQLHYRKTKESHIFSTTEDEKSKVWIINKQKTKKEAFQIVMSDIIHEYNERNKRFQERSRFFGGFTI